MRLDNHADAMAEIALGLAAMCPGRIVTRALQDMAAYSEDDLLAGVLTVVSDGGSDFANYLGREGDLGTVAVAVLGYVKVDEGTDAGAIEAAELALLGDVLRWVNQRAPGGQVDMAIPTAWRQSKQIEHPYGWIVVELQVR